MPAGLVGIRRRRKGRVTRALSGSTPHEASSSIVAVTTPNVLCSSAVIVVPIADLPLSAWSIRRSG
jgi:hypothetical protein